MGRDMYLRISFGELMCMIRAAVEPGRFMNGKKDVAVSYAAEDGLDVDAVRTAFMAIDDALLRLEVEAPSDQDVIRIWADPIIRNRLETGWIRVTLKDLLDMMIQCLMVRRLPKSVRRTARTLVDALDDCLAAAGWLRGGYRFNSEPYEVPAPSFDPGGLTDDGAYMGMVDGLAAMLAEHGVTDTGSRPKTGGGPRGIVHETAGRRKAGTRPSGNERRKAGAAIEKETAMMDRTGYRIDDWYDGVDRDGLEHMHVLAWLGGDAFIEGDLEPCGGTSDAMGIALQDTKRTIIPIIRTSVHGNALMDGVRNVELLWDGRVWRMTDMHDASPLFAVNTESGLHIVDRWEDKDGTGYAVVRLHDGKDGVREMWIPESALFTYLTPVHGWPDEPGYYQGADGSVWCLSERSGVWSIPEHGFAPTRIIHKGDIPAKALPLKRMAGPPGVKGAAPDEGTDPARIRTEDAR